MTTKNISRMLLAGVFLASLAFVVYTETIANTNANTTAAASPSEDRKQTDPSDNTIQRADTEADKNIHLPVYGPSSYWIGVRVVPVPEILLSHFGVTEPDSSLAVVERVVENGPAAKAGLKRGDVILHFADRDIRTLNDLVEQVAAVKDSPRKMIIVRHGAKTELTVTPEKRPDEPIALPMQAIPKGMLPRGFSRGLLPRDPHDGAMMPPGMKLGREIWLGTRDPQEMMKEMEEYFRQMQGGNDADQLLLLPDSDQPTNSPVDGTAKRLEVSSQTDQDGKTTIRVRQIDQSGDQTREKTWEADSLDALPDEIRGDVKALFGQ